MIEADQAKLVYKFKKIKIKIFKINLNIKFNKKCLLSKIIPNYVNININSKSQAAKRAKHKAQLNWISNEIKEQYLKKMN